MKSPWHSLKPKNRYHRGRLVPVAESLPEVDRYSKLETFRRVPYEQVMAWRLNTDFSEPIGFDYQRAWLVAAVN